MNILRSALACAALMLASGIVAAAEHSLEILALNEAVAGSELRIGGLHRGVDAQTWLSLRPVPIFSDEARVVLNDGVNEQDMALPAVRHYVGSERGEAGRLAFVSVHPDGSVRGWLRNGSRIEAFGLASGEAGSARIEPVDLDAPELADRQFHCGSDELPLLSGSEVPDTAAALSAALRGTPTAYVARIAIDTDAAYFGRFDNATDAALYVADLIGVISATYSAEIQTSLQLSYVRLWTGGTDPWSEPVLGCRLRQFGKHWNDQMTHVPRALAHLLSGGPGGGIAWLGTLCRSNLNASLPSGGCETLTGSGNYGGHYGVSAGIRGNLNPGNPQVVWDLVVVAHELGHNFNSSHTHCYANVGGNPEPVDQCHGTESGNNCYSGPGMLPGPQGAGSGTIMSYCHLRAGGINNMANSLGTGHPYGVEPGRVPARMRARVENALVQQPGCLFADLIYADGFQVN